MGSLIKVHTGRPDQTVKNAIFNVFREQEGHMCLIFSTFRKITPLKTVKTVYSRFLTKKAVKNGIFTVFREKSQKYRF